MDHPRLKRFGENFEKMFLEFFWMPLFQTQTEAVQIWLGVFIVRVSSPVEDWAQYLAMYRKKKIKLKTIENTDYFVVLSLLKISYLTFKKY